MAEEENAEKGAKSGIVKKLIIVAAIVLVAGGAGLATYMIVIAPMFAEPETVEDDVDRIPITTVLVDFDTLRATVLPANGENAAPALLQYSVSLACANEATRLLVEARRQMFQEILVRLHDARTREELNDPVAKESLLRQVKQEINALLKRLQETEDPTIQVTDVMYTEYTVLEL